MLELVAHQRRASIIQVMTRYLTRYYYISPSEGIENLLHECQALFAYWMQNRVSPTFKWGLKIAQLLK